MANYMQSHMLKITTLSITALLSHCEVSSTTTISESVIFNLSSKGISSVLGIGSDKFGIKLFTETENHIQLKYLYKLLQSH